MIPYIKLNKNLSKTIATLMHVPEIDHQKLNVILTLVDHQKLNKRSFA